MTLPTSFKKKSRLITAISFIITILAFISVDEWASVLPQDFVFLAPTLVAVIGYIASQLSEEARVVRAEEIAVKKAETEQRGVTLNEEPILNDEYVYSETVAPNTNDDDDGC